MDHTMTKRKVMRTMRHPFLTVSETVCGGGWGCMCMRMCMCVSPNLCDELVAVSV